MFTTKVDQMLTRSLATALLATVSLGWTEPGFGQSPGKGAPPEQLGQETPQPGEPPVAETPAPRRGRGASSPRALPGLPGTAGSTGAPSGAGPGMAPAEPASVAEMLGMALQANPDLAVARAKVAEAEAELRRVQLDVARRVIRQRQEIENQKAKIARVERLLASKTISPDELSEAVHELSVLENELQYLLGKSPEMPGMSSPMMMGMMPGTMQGMGMPGMGSGMPGMAPGRPGGLGGGGQPPASRGQTGAGGSSTPAGGKGEDAVPKALQTKISLKVENAPLHDVLKRLQESAHVKFVVNTARLSQAGVPLDTPVTIDVEEVPLAAVLQLIEDLHPPLGFSIRDYGILVTEGPVNPRDTMMNMMRSMRGR